MADKKDFPDISGIFDVDESRIPGSIIDKPAGDARERQAAERPILLRDENSDSARDAKRAQKAEKERKRKEKKEAAKKRRRSAAIKLGAIVLALLIVVGGVALLISNAKRPAVTLAEAQTMDISRHYDAPATVVNDPLGKGSDRLYAVFVENNYDVYGIEKEQHVQITNSEGRVVSGVVAEITKEDSGSGLIERILNMIANGVGVSTNSNYTVIVLPDDPTAVEENMTVDVRVLLEEHENVLCVPDAAVRREEGQAYVWVYRSFGKKLDRKDVETGLASDGMTEIVKGLDENDMVAVAWSCAEADLHSGIRIKPSAEQLPAPSNAAQPESGAADAQTTVADAVG